MIITPICLNFNNYMYKIEISNQPDIALILIDQLGDNNETIININYNDQSASIDITKADSKEININTLEILVTNLLK